MNQEAQRLKTLALHVTNMRRAQREYFNAPSAAKAAKAEALKVAKQHEQQTDAYIKQLEFEKLI